MHRVLIIDDCQAIHADFHKILGSGPESPSGLNDAEAALFGAPSPSAHPPLKFEVDSALQGEEGFKKLEAANVAGRPYSVAFVDMRMPPGWDGLTTIEKIWEVDRDVQIVICTAYTDQSWQQITDKLGYTDRLLVLKKPFDPVEVLQLATAMGEKWTLRRTAQLKINQLEEMVKQRTSELAQLALHDKLTGLPNRALLNDRIAQALKRRRQNNQYNFAVFFLDFDRFKLINDSMGHEVGDLLLTEIGNRLRTALRDADTVAIPSDQLESTAARLGGDEFVILLDGLRSPVDAARVAERLLIDLSRPYHLKSFEVHTTASIGITTSELGYEKAEDIVRDADTAMYHAKAAGKARFVLFDRRMHQDAVARLELENDLRHALERNELELFYQPIICLQSGRVHGFEALARWRRNGQLVSPADFIPCCEETGVIVPIGDFLLGLACKQLRQWQDRFPQKSPLSMSVNLSARQLSSPGFVGRVRDIIARAGIAPATLALEITESMMIRDMETAIGVLSQFREMGVKLHMDDFGTGYSSLSCLHRLPLDGLKVDRSFVKNLSERRDYAAVVQAIIQLARNLGIKLIAEGIETVEQLTMLQSMECDRAQGYYFAKPGDVATIDEFLEGNGGERQRLAA